jgi:hypothetical protein
MKTVTVIAILTLVLVGCADPGDAGSGSSTTTEPTTTTSTTTTTLPPEPTLVFTVEFDGGCMMMGPNCAGYRFFSDGSVELYRTNLETSETEHEATIDASLVAEVEDELATTDLVELRAMLPEGECQACYDGMDTTYIYEVGSRTTEFDSAKVELLSSVGLFAATEQALTAAQETLDQLEIQSR